MQVFDDWQPHSEPLEDVFDDVVLALLGKTIDENCMVRVTKQLRNGLPEHFFTASPGVAAWMEEPNHFWRLLLRFYPRLRLVDLIVRLDSGDDGNRGHNDDENC